MAEVAHVLVVLGRAGERERVVAADGVADDLDERLEVDWSKNLRVEPGLRVRVAHQRAGRGRVEAALAPGLRACAAWKARKSEHWRPSDVDDLDVLARLHLVGERRWRGRPRKSRRGSASGARQLGLERRRAASRAADLEQEVGGGHAALDASARRAPRRRDRGALGANDASRPAATRAEQPRRIALVGSSPRAASAARNASALAVAGRQRAQHRGLGVGAQPERAAVLAAVGASTVSSARWPPSTVADGEPVVRLERDHGRRRRAAPGSVSRAGSTGRRPGTSRRGRVAAAMRL